MTWENIICLEIVFPSVTFVPVFQNIYDILRLLLASWQSRKSYEISPLPAIFRPLVNICELAGRKYGALFPLGTWELWDILSVFFFNRMYRLFSEYSALLQYFRGILLWNTNT